MKKAVSILTLLIVLLLASFAIAADKVVIIPLFKSNAEQCPDGLSNCSGNCVDTINNPNFCGDCSTKCGEGSHCSNGACTKPLSHACSTKNECVTGYCADGVCCNAACSSTCESCINADTGGIDGICGYIQTNTDPYNECGGTDVCNGSGSCVKILGEPCATGSDCLSGNCVDGVCCDTSCKYSCEACIATKTGGADGTCENIIANTDPDNECADSLVCGVTGVCGKPLGAKCSTGSECSSKICVEGGVCCNTTCSSTCESCIGVLTGGVDGTCSHITDGLDPYGECGATHYCNGYGGCQTCFDNIQNGVEDDTDCGDPACGILTCPAGSTCDSSSDCVTKYCNTSGICQ